MARWSPPQAPQSWSVPRDATAFGPCCPQPLSPFAELNSFENNSNLAEDCLSLNVWSPVGAANLPVLVYIHGGGYVTGCSGRDRYHGSFMAGSTPTVVVTINYRLGVFGFLAGRELSGNYGIMDQQYALKWVQKNIAAFGGDPTKVTLDGQSAGAISVATHLAMPSTAQNRPFRAAIMQSDPVLIQFRTLAEQQPEYDVFSSAVGCGFAASRLDCMRALKWETLLASQNWALAPYVLNNTWQNVVHKLPWTPTIDGELITQTPSTAFQTGNFYKVPIMLCTVANETTGFLPLVFGEGAPGVVLGGLFYKSGLDTFFGNSLASKIRAMYPSSRTTSEDAVGRVLTDFAFICPVLQSANWISQYVPTYVYQLTHAPSCDPNNYHHSICNGRVCHSADVDFVFHTISLDRRGACNWSPEETNLSWQMMFSWTNFTANPTSFSNVPRWTGNNVLQFDIPSSVFTATSANSNCNFWYDVASGKINN